MCLLLGTVGGRCVANVEEHLGLRDFFERGAKAGDERVGQITDEADRVRQENAAAAWQFDGAEFGIERGEHARGRKHLRAGDCVEERAFAGVGVADESDRGDGDGFAALSLLAASSADGFKRELEVIDASLNLAAIGFKLGFARPASADAAAQLGHGFATAREARQHVFELGELDLELTFAGAGVTGKNVEDELGAIEDATGQRSFKVAQLRGREVVIEENEIGVGGSGDGCDLLDFAGADEGCGIWARATLNDFGGDLATGTEDKLAKFGERFFNVETGGIETGSVGAGRIRFRRGGIGRLGLDARSCRIRAF